jgi:hypothetical protein
MAASTIIAIFLFLYGLACLYVGLAKPKAVWKLGNIQSFVQLLGERGTVIMLVIVAAVSSIGGILILVLI